MSLAELAGPGGLTRFGKKLVSGGFECSVAPRGVKHVLNENEALVSLTYCARDPSARGPRDDVIQNKIKIIYFRVSYQLTLAGILY
jgi:hypothetical protein